ncbi:MAG: ECF-type sigma factor [Phycisphaerae bacterium]|nr:ECF-type sigma factor [Phycisphaerae bacterium]
MDTPSLEPDPIAALYGELRRLAGAMLRRERPDHTLQTTELVHEAYLRIGNDPALVGASRAFVFAVASKVIRDVLVDHARKRGQVKRGAGWRKISLSEADVSGGEGRAVDLLDLDDAMVELASEHPRRSQVIEMRYFGGMGNDEIAEVLGVSVRTVTEDWSGGREWLHRRLARGARE